MSIARRWWVRQPQGRRGRLKFWFWAWVVALTVGLVRHPTKIVSAAILTLAVIVTALVIEWAEAYAKRHPESRHHRKSN